MEKSDYFDDKLYILKNEISAPIKIDLSDINFSKEEDFKEAKKQREIIEFSKVIESDLEEVDIEIGKYRSLMRIISQKIEEIKKKVDEEGMIK